MAPTTTKQYTLHGTSGFDDIKLEEAAPIPSLGDHDILVKIHGVSLNYRDLIIPKVSHHPSPIPHLSQKSTQLHATTRKQEKNSIL